MSPSAITLMRAPASRISAIRSSCRGRSSTTAVMSATLRPNASATACRFSETLRLRSITPLATGPTAIFFMYIRGTRVMPSGLARGQDRERADAAAGDHRRPLDRVAAPARAAARRRPPRRPAPADGPPRCGRSRSGRRAASPRAPRPSPRWRPRRPPGRHPGPDSGRPPAPTRSVTDARSVHGHGRRVGSEPAVLRARSAGRVAIAVRVPRRARTEARSRIRSSTVRSASSPSVASITGTPTRSARATR